MPIYEYQCSKCEHKLEAIQKFSDAPLTDCPECHESALKKLISAASFRLKGGGWYETDFKKEGRKQLAESDSSAPAAGSTGSASNDAAKKSADSGDSSTKTDTAVKKTKADTAKKS